MCGNCGLLRITPKISPAALAFATGLFTRLFLLSEHRGPLASGAVWLDASGQHRIHKAPLPASDFIATAGYENWLGSLPPTAVLLMGHPAPDFLEQVLGLFPPATPPDDDGEDPPLIIPQQAPECVLVTAKELVEPNLIHSHGSVLA